MQKAMIVTYGLKAGQTSEGFEQWLREVDLPGYARLTSMRNPIYYRASGLLGEDTSPPFAYLAVIEMTSPEAVEQELGRPEWAGFIADFEARTTDARFIVGERILP